MRTRSSRASSFAFHHSRCARVVNLDPRLRTVTRRLATARAPRRPPCAWSRPRRPSAERTGRATRPGRTASRARRRCAVRTGSRSSPGGGALPPCGAGRRGLCTDRCARAAPHRRTGAGCTAPWAACQRIASRRWGQAGWPARLPRWPAARQGGGRRAGRAPGPGGSAAPKWGWLGGAGVPGSRGSSGGSRGSPGGSRGARGARGTRGPSGARACSAAAGKVVAAAAARGAASPNGGAVSSTGSSAAGQEGSAA
mmetsp:Transcript_32448/g.103462  ORF Transcript_32448/g.103462 Transcript_32448/m.103462 type:complete len:254 (+) Transcript_32448:765-1526(+)